MDYKRGRGRPLGYRLSEESKRAISESKKGQKHSEETKEKISKTLLQYFRNLHPLSKELYEDYKDVIDSNPEVRSWYNSIVSDYDSSSDFFTEKSLNSKRLREISIEYNIDMSSNLNINSILSNPEKFSYFKILCEERNIDLWYVLHVACSGTVSLEAMDLI